jgi:DNA (cytosine-5)-methyltransferase 1
LPKEQLRNLTKKDTTKFKRLSRQEPSNTLRCGEIFFHPKENRYLTPREYMRIHGYPDSYILRGPIRGRSGRVRHLDQHRQIANSVPPPIARLLAEEVLKVLNAKKQSKPENRHYARFTAGFVMVAEIVICPLSNYQNTPNLLVTLMTRS